MFYFAINTITCNLLYKGCLYDNATYTKSLTYNLCRCRFFCELYSIFLSPESGRKNTSNDQYLYHVWIYCDVLTRQSDLNDKVICNIFFERADEMQACKLALAHSPRRVSKHLGRVQILDFCCIY